MNLIFTRLRNTWITGKKGAADAPLLAAILILALTSLLAGCSGGDVTASANTTTESTSSSTVSSDGTIIYLDTSQNSIITDRTDKATITATVVKNNVSQANVPITFKTTAGLLNNPNIVTTDANGKAEIILESGPRAINQVATVEASTNSGASSTIPVQITGNKLELTLSQSQITIGKHEHLKSAIKNAIPLGISATSVTFFVESGSDLISLPNFSTTDYEGVADIEVWGLKPGTATIVAYSMGATARIKVNISDLAFEIVSPVPPEETPDAPIDLANNNTLQFTVRAPAPTTKVIFHTSIGVWNSKSNEEEVSVVDGFATATLTSPSSAGTASVTVYDKDRPTTQDAQQVNIFAPANEAYYVTLQTSQANVAITPVDATSKNSVTLTAKVLNINNYPVGGGVVNFTLSNITGGGENLSSSMVVTNSFGVATCTFYSGSLGSSGTGVRITATVPTSGKSDNIDITIRDLAGSVVIGRASKMVSSLDETAYTQKITAQVSDANGNSVSGAIVSLNLWPVYYFLGAEVIDPGTNSCTGYYTNSWPIPCSGIGAIKNEDLNKNMTLDSGEDVGPFDMTRGIMFPDGFLTPANSSAGSVPATVITDANGTATFDFTYLKRYAMWVAVELTATVKVQGTETQGKMLWRLDALQVDIDGCDLFSSPFGYYAEICM
jgi:hypothetical protein